MDLQASRLLQLLRWLVRALRPLGLVQQALKRIILRLGQIFSASFPKQWLGRKVRSRISLADCNTTNERNKSLDGLNNVDRKIINISPGSGERVSLENVAFAMYPPTNGNRDAARSMASLNSAILHHRRSISPSMRDVSRPSTPNSSFPNLVTSNRYPPSLYSHSTMFDGSRSSSPRPNVVSGEEVSITGQPVTPYSIIPQSSVPRPPALYSHSTKFDGSRSSSPRPSSLHSVSSKEVTITVEPVAPSLPFLRTANRASPGSLPELVITDDTSQSLTPSVLNEPLSGSLNSDPNFYSRLSSVTCLQDPSICPTMPEAHSTLRYNDRVKIPYKTSTMILGPFERQFSKPHAPPDWERCTHPEGGRYFRHKLKKIYTDADLLNEKVLDAITNKLSCLEDFIAENNIIIPETADLVVNFQFNPKDVATAIYYYADHRFKSIFFLDKWEASDLEVFNEVPGCTTENHLYHEVQAQYWLHVQLYPCCFQITQELLSMFRGQVLHFLGDNMTSPTSISPWPSEELTNVLRYLDSLERNLNYEDHGGVSFFGRISYIFANARFLHHCGEPQARLDRCKSVYDPPERKHTWLITYLSPILFYAPDFHLKTLQEVWVDRTMHKTVWLESMKKMNNEWQEFVLFATVILNANVGFLGALHTNFASHSRTPAEILSYLSVIASVGSIVLGLLLIRQNRTKNQVTLNAMLEYLTTNSHEKYGLETLAILHSLPYSLLMWSMIAFVAAFCLMSLLQTNFFTQIPFASAAFAVSIFIFWCVYTTWNNYDGSSIFKTPLTINRALDSSV